MSQPESKDETNNKIAADGALGAEITISPKAKKQQDLGAISKTSTTKKGNKIDLSSAMEVLSLNNFENPNAEKRKEVRPRDSLETIPLPADIINSKSPSFTIPKNVDKNYADLPHSESFLGNNTIKTPSCTAPKSALWDPWEKTYKRGKKENKRRKFDKFSEHSSTPSPSTSSPPKETFEKHPTNRKDFKSGDEAFLQQTENQSLDAASYDEYAYQPYHPKSIRSVEFTNKVMVVYINKEDKVVGEASEPLKKELEQQIRNKEMRRGHLPDVTFAKRNVMTDWFKNK